MTTWEFVIAFISAIGSIIGSFSAIKWTIKHEIENCNERMEAFKEGLDRSEKDH